MKNKFIYTLLFVATSLISHLSFGQIIYQHAFGTSTFTAVNPYTVTPNTIDPNLSASQWSTSIAAGFTTFAGSTGQALSVSNSSATPTYSLTFNVAPGFTCSITDFSFWRQRSNTGAQTWTLSVNGTTVGAGATPTAGVNTGTLAVSNPVNGLSGTVNVVLKLSGASGTGSFRLDDFTLYGAVNPTVTCTPPTIQATTFSVASVGSNSVSINWTPGNGGNVIVLASAGAPVSGTPSSGNSYAASPVFGSGQQIGGANYVVYNNTGSSVIITGLSSATTYYFSVFEYNTTSGFPCYLSPALTGSVTLGACTPPATQASLFNVTAIGTTSATINWTAGSGGNAIVLARSTTPVTSAPVSGTSYAPASTIYGNGGEVVVGTANYLVYDGTGTSVTVTNLNPGTAYYFEVFEYNITGVDTCYLTPGLTGSLTALAAPVPTTCLQIKSILVNACDGTIESYNEMVYFRNGSNPLPINQLSLAGAPKSGIYAMGKWPNNGNLWNGAVMNATTSANVATINGSVTKCGYVLEPPLVAGIGTIPPNAYVILVGSQVMSPTANSFANLTDTVYMIFQSVSTTTAGNFVNWSANNIGTRGLVLIDNANACTSNTVTYEPQLLLNHSDGDGASYNSNNTVSYFNNGCQAPYTPLGVDAGPNQTICYNSQALLTATPSGVYNSVTWSGGSGIFSSPTSLTTTYTPGASETGTIALQCTITRSCAASTASVTDVVVVSITSLPVFSLTASNGYSLCPGGTSVLSYSVINAANAGVLTPSWSSPAVSGPTYTVSSPTGTAAVTYSIDLSNSCGNVMQTFTVYPLVLPTVSLSATNPTACVGSTLTLSASGNTGNYSWNNPVSTSSMVTITAGTTTTGIVTSTNSCGSASDVYTLTVTQNPTISVDNANVNLCIGQSATVTATSSSGTYSWTPDAVNTNTIVVNTAGTHTVQTDNVCNTASATVNVVVSAAATLSISATSNSVCLGGQVTSTLSLNGSTGSYTWSNGANSSTIAITAPGVYSATVDAGFCGLANASFTIETLPTPSISVASTPTLLCNGASATITATSNLSNFIWSDSSVNTNFIVVTASGLYTVGVTNACGSPSASINILADTSPTLNLVSSTPTLCPAQSATLTVTGGLAAGPYSWSNSASTGSVVTTTGGTVSVSYTNVCGSDTKTISVTAAPNPIVTIAVKSFTICPGNTVNVVATSSESNYAWSGSSNATATLVLMPSFSTIGTVSSTNACNVSATDTYTINVISPPILTVDATSPIVLCNGQSTVVTASSSAGNYTWMPGGSTNNTLNINSTGDYTVYTSNACTRDSVIVKVTIGGSPSLTLTSSSNTICPNQTATLTVTGGTSPYVWSNSSSTGSIVTSNGGTVSVSNTNGCGTGTQTVNVVVVNLNADFIANPTSGILPVVVSFTNNSIGASSYVWDFGNGSVASTQTVSPQTYSVAGIYTVSLLATNGSCSDTYFFTISVLNEEPILIIPNVFTPNNDSVNDVFKISSKNIIELSCTIFDRWGLQMYSWNELKGGWDGKTDGKEVPDGTYFYIINAKDIDGKEIKKQGAVSLFK